jgi:hypothetical protein
MIVSQLEFITMFTTACHIPLSWASLFPFSAIYHDFNSSCFGMQEESVSYFVCLYFDRLNIIKINTHCCWSILHCPQQSFKHILTYVTGKVYTLWQPLLTIWTTSRFCWSCIWTSKYHWQGVLHYVKVSNVVALHHMVSVDRWNVFLDVMCVHVPVCPSVCACAYA